MAISPKLRYTLKKAKKSAAKASGVFIPLTATAGRLEIVQALPAFSAQGITIHRLSLILDRGFNSLCTAVRELEAGGFVRRGKMVQNPKSGGKWAYSWTQAERAPDFLPVLPSGRPSYPKARSATSRVLFPLLDFPISAGDLRLLYPESLPLPSLEALRRRLRTLSSNGLVTRSSDHHPLWRRTPLWEEREKTLPPFHLPTSD